MISLAAKEREDKEKDIWHTALAGKCLLIDQLKCYFRVDSQSIVNHNRSIRGLYGGQSGCMILYHVVQINQSYGRIGIQGRTFLD